MYVTRKDQLPFTYKWMIGGTLPYCWYCRRGTLRRMARRLLSPAQWKVIDYALSKRGLSGDAPIAQIAGASLASVSRWRSGIHGISDEKFQRIATHLDIPYARLADPEGFDRAMRAVNPSVPVEPTKEVIAVPVRAEASAGRGSGSLIPGEVIEVAASAVGRKSLVAVRISGRCMYPRFLPDDTVVFEKVADDEIRNGDTVLITLLDQEEDGAYLVKYFTWARNGEDKVILTAEDDTRIEALYDRVVIEGRYLMMIRK